MCVRASSELPQSIGLEDVRRLTGGNDPRRDVLLHEAESPDHTASSDANTGHDDGVVADPDIVFDGDRASRDRIALLKKLGRVGAGVTVNHDSDRERHVVPDLDPGTPAMNHTTRIDVHVVSDQETMLLGAKKDGTSPNPDIVAKLDKVGMHVFRKVDVGTGDITSTLHDSPQCAWRLEHEKGPLARPFPVC